jgi:putative nucleotidyltransferase with HDIG domain
MEVANDPDSGASEIKDVMESDPALTARVLRYVNSSAIGLRQRITNLQYAIAYLGVKQIRNLAMTAAVSDLFIADGGTGAYDRSGLWRHLVSVGICTRLLALQLSMVNFEDLFLAGLLHDLGIILEDQYAHQPFQQIMAVASEEVPFVKLEREYLGFDHTELGEKVAENWRFPETVRAAIRHHHSSASYTGDHLSVVRCVDVANMICTVKGLTSIGLKWLQFSPSAIEGLSVTRDDIQVLAARLDDELRNNSALFDI